ncbi:MAG: hypothetical protein CMB24_00780 [Euryarchaeota archaeon]|jgi:hypothetical protein|nr:hypothetical protein [Euryarchaeota archaeon]|tara:strand:+ start:1358 stop:1666 length:309 start_codon:yes stop_codon:yes gene_type:complete
MKDAELQVGVCFLYLRLSQMFMGTEGGREPVRSYDRSWTEIEEMLDKAVARRDQWKKWFDQCSKDGDRDGMKEAARNHKALDGVIKTLRWTLGEEGVDHPLD